MSRAVTRPAIALVLVAWVATMAVLVRGAYGGAASANLATDLARYGSAAVWRGVYYRGEKIGFTVSQTLKVDEGFELQEDGRLQMLLLGQDTAARIRTTARVDERFALRSFEFSLDPGTGPTTIAGVVEPPTLVDGPYRVRMSVTSSGATRTETRELPEAPVLSQNLARVLAGKGLTPGARHDWTVLDPATLQSATVAVHVGDRGVVRANDTMVPAFRVELDFRGLRTTAWVTDTGDVVREESPLGLMTVREPAERAQGLAVPGRVQADLLQLAAVVPVTKERIDEPRDVRRLSLRLQGIDLAQPVLDGVGQRVSGDTIELTDARLLQPGAPDPDAARYLAPEALIESDDPAIRDEAARALAGVEGDRARAERLTRYVNGLLDKKPTVSLPSAREVLRTRVGDCNEHTALFVAMARAAGIPARIAVGLVYMHGAFYYHAWPEVYLAEGTRGLWLPVDPTLNQFPADATHLRLARGGLEQQAAIVPLIGRLEMTLVDLELAPGTDRVIVGREPDAAAALAALPLDLPAANTSGCRCSRGQPSSTGGAR